MLFALGAVSSALDAIQSLTNSKSSSATQKAGSTHKTGSPQGATNPFAIDSSSMTSSLVGSGSPPQIAPATMTALLAAQSQSTDGASGATSSTSSAPSTSKGRQAALKDLFSQIDADGDGKITKAEFEDALSAGGTNLAQADDVFSKMDANSDDSINLGEMTKALTSGHGRHQAQSAGGSGDAAGGGSESSKASRGSTSTTTTNADGSTITTVTYADGFKMSTTVPGASRSSTANSGGNSPYDWFGQMMQRQAQAASTASSTSMSV
ncbi:EF-hand domain-containing protein [Bradyrhizobium sp. 180]|uniref:EF-hand domain-containing protein n=1 Tax=unclassified Bradyrhizobium TaxID=2631580 RepID=UPI001FF9A4C8|nr:MULTISPECIES: EF-hand domain-containing protein [unclassified Bradyrhizobium]MCK1424386.1 EF-hand domain-containing protein [Bradyrhizobium sp. CW12]MCK1495494.1 EF-hand domain-containing protein [Bradyrhizobium sp. 180]MCK1529164.1 EF-hand domain-containing protein [Bradyrhizobium sp. 182]MCK1596353.1 EF-hand domain-containing protein [Bradyrhizobium sp. 164]MCK1618831.1 EF-hand domain-containing protein [Bradyrhizobium sp. 159]